MFARRRHSIIIGAGGPYSPYETTVAIAPIPFGIKEENSRKLRKRKD
jgi:hypothetical protein